MAIVVELFLVRAVDDCLVIPAAACLYRTERSSRIARQALQRRAKCGFWRSGLCPAMASLLLATLKSTTNQSKASPTRNMRLNLSEPHFIMADIELARRVFKDSKSIHSWKLAPEVGLEPTTTRLTAACSTIELLWNPEGPEIYKSTILPSNRFSAYTHQNHLQALLLLTLLAIKGAPRCLNKPYDRFSTFVTRLSMTIIN